MGLLCSMVTAALGGTVFCNIHGDERRLYKKGDPETGLQRIGRH